MPLNVLDADADEMAERVVRVPKGDSEEVEETVSAEAEVVEDPGAVLLEEGAADEVSVELELAAALEVVGAAPGETLDSTAELVVVGATTVHPCESVVNDSGQLVTVVVTLPLTSTVVVALSLTDTVTVV